MKILYLPLLLALGTLLGGVHDKKWERVGTAHLYEQWERIGTDHLYAEQQPVKRVSREAMLQYGVATGQLGATLAGKMQGEQEQLTILTQVSESSEEEDSPETP